MFHSVEGGREGGGGAGGGIWGGECQFVRTWRRDLHRRWPRGRGPVSLNRLRLGVTTPCGMGRSHPRSSHPVINLCVTPHSFPPRRFAERPRVSVPHLRKQNKAQVRSGDVAVNQN